MEDIKQIVKEKYSEIAKQSRGQNATSCCGATSCCSEVDYFLPAELGDPLFLPCKHSSQRPWWCSMDRALCEQKKVQGGGGGGV